MAKKSSIIDDALKDSEETGKIGESQAIEAYACSCGFTSPELGAFRGHLLSNAKDKENHHSMGRINIETGEIVMPPADQRTPEQWKEAKYGKKTEGKKSSKSEKSSSMKPIDNISGATEVKFVPRVYTIDYSPILRMAFDAAVKIFGWRADMPFGNFLDTVIYLYFKEKGVTLAGYVVDDDLLQSFEEERREAEAQILAEAGLSDEEIYGEDSELKVEEVPV